MPNTIRIKRRASGSIGAPTTLENAELAFNEVDMTLYYGKGTGGAGGSATTIEAIGGSGAFVGLSNTQTITGNKTFSGTISLGSSATATTPAGSSNDTTVATTAFVKALGLGSGSVTSVGLSLPAIFTVTNSPVITSGTLTATLVSQSANQVFVAPNGSSGAPTFRSLVAADIPTLTSVKISDFDTQVRTNRLDQMAQPTNDVPFNNRKITGLADPTQNQDAATKAYVDVVSQGIHTHTSARLATAAALPTSTYSNGTGGINATITGTTNGALSVDSVAVAVNDRILVKDQANAFENGMYVVTNTGGVSAVFVLTRSTDMNQDVEFPGSFEFVEEGTVNADNGYVVTTNLPVTIGTTGITWTQFSGAGQITAGAGLTKSGNIIDVATASSSRIVINVDNIDLATTGVSASTYKSVTVDTYGRVTAGTNPTTLSGYGIVDAQALDATLTALAGVSTSANTLIYATASDTFTTTSFTTFGRSLVDDADASTSRTTLGLGTMATQNASSVTITGGTIDNIIFDGGVF